MPRPYPTQAEIERAVRAAKKLKANSVCLRPDGTIVIKLIGDGDSEYSLEDQRAIEDEMIALLQEGRPAPKGRVGHSAK